MIQLLGLWVMRETCPNNDLILSGNPSYIQGKLAPHNWLIEGRRVQGGAVHMYIYVFHNKIKL